jgi:hypothetical protein
MVDRTWALAPQHAKGKVYPRFTIELLRAPTTADLGVGYALPLESAEERKFLALNVRMPSLLDTVVPPGYGFAILAPDGRVLFHSEEALSLQENFFEEVGDPAGVRARAASINAATWSGEYHGRSHRLHMRRVTAFTNSPWRIVTFQELEPALSAIGAHQSGTFRLALINMVALGILGVVVLAWGRTKQGSFRDALRLTSAVDPRSLVPMIVLAVVAVVAIALTYAPAARDWLDVLYVFFFALPFAAVLLAGHARRRSSAPTAVPLATRRGWLLLAARMGLIVVLAAALPAAGFARIVDRAMHSMRHERWLEDVQRRIAVRNERVVARINSINYPRPSTTAAQAKEGATRDLLLAANAFGDTSALDKYAYLTFLEGVAIGEWGAGHPAVNDPCAAAPGGAREQPSDASRPDHQSGAQPAAGESPVRPDTGQRAVRFLLKWNPLPSRDDAGCPRVALHGNSLRLDALVSGSPRVSVEDTGRQMKPIQLATAYSLPWGKVALGLGVLCGVLAAAAWARGRVVRHTAGAIPRLRHVLPEVLKAQGNVGVMLIGPPRTRKDHLVVSELHRIKASALVRIRLLDAALTDDVIAGHAKEVADLAAKLPAADRVWIHVSNLEAQLVDADNRRRALHLLEKLLDKQPGQRAAPSSSRRASIRSPTSGRSSARSGRTSMPT